MNELFVEGCNIKVTQGLNIGRTGIILSIRETNDPNKSYSCKIRCDKNGEIFEILESKLEIIAEAKEDRYPKVGPFYYYRNKKIISCTKWLFAFQNIGVAL